MGSSRVHRLPFISVITPSYNQGAFIRETIESVLQQNYPRYEHIVADGGSTDGTVDVLRSYPHLCWVSEPDEGQSDAFNKGLAVVSPQSEVICWLNSDDTLCPGAFHVVGERFSQHPEHAVLIGNTVYVDEEGRLLKQSAAQLISANDLVHGCANVQQPSTFFRRRVFQEVGSLDETLHYAMDHDFFIRVLREYSAMIVDADLARFRFHSRSKSRTMSLGFVFEGITVRRRHGAQLLSPGMIALYYHVLTEPLRRIRPLRSLVRRLRGKDPEGFYL